jgi:hypothetical protein
MDRQDNAFLPILKTASIDFLSRINPILTLVSSGHIPINVGATLYPQMMLDTGQLMRHADQAIVCC